MRRFRPLSSLAVCTVLAGLMPGLLQAAGIDECRTMLLHGEYEDCIRETAAAIQADAPGESWIELKARAEFTLGRYDEALKTIIDGIQRNPASIRLRWMAMQVGPYGGVEDSDNAVAEQIAVLVQGSPWRYTDAENLVAMGEFAVSQGADAKRVQESFFDRAKRNNPLHRAPVLALANLALDKRDFGLAADTLNAAKETHPHDPEIFFGLARAFEESDAQQSTQMLLLTLEENPRHLDAMVMQADSLIDGERYDEARARLDQVLEINPRYPDALALQAVIAMLLGEDDRAEELREKALSSWKKNPRVDHLIGKKLSQKYRFEEGSERQRQALRFDPGHLPAKKQLAQDLLRLGREAEGWRLAEEVYRQDEYDVGSYNLVTLREELERFATLSDGGFTVRMDRHEADVYGDRVLELLQTAREVICPKYDIELTDEVLVEIFPKPADFAVRTFGMPGVNGYLGVCFGDVITANSPASQQITPANWESVLWHEFVHVVTLNKTNNRMPRWLSEGISVYEERQRDQTWGERMSPLYRQMILDGRLRPVSQMSQAFLSPGSSQNLMFAYFQSSMVVEYLIKTHGYDALLAVLDDLAVGMNINEALERHTVPMNQLEEEFEKYAMTEARLYGWAVDWSEPKITSLLGLPDTPERLMKWAAEHGLNYRGLKECGSVLMQLGRPELALKVYASAVEAFPDETGPESPLAQLATLQRQTGDVEGELKSLRRLADIDDTAISALLRLIEVELQKESPNWEQLRGDALKLIAIRPLVPQPHNALALAAEKLDDRKEAIRGLSSLLVLSPPDLANLHYRLAVQYQDAGEREKARRNVLKALERAPRYRDALSLLLEVQPSAEQESDDPDAVPAEATPTP